MENFLSAGRRGQISHSASAVRGNFSGLCCLPSHTANEKCPLHYRMGQHKCLELKTTTLWPIVGKSSEGIAQEKPDVSPSEHYTSGNILRG